MKFPVRATSSRPSITEQERVFVRQFGDKPSVVKYSGRESLVGLKVLGKRSGFRIEQNADGRYIRALDIIQGFEVPTKRVLKLRFTDSARMLVPGVRSWVR